MKRSIVGAVLTASLLLAPLAHAETAYVPIGDPYTDTIQLWSDIATIASLLRNNVAAFFDGAHFAAAQPATPSAALAAAAANAEPAQQPSQQVITYTVESGDTLSGIAQTYNVSLASLLAANDLTQGAILRPGDNLIIPDPQTAPATTSGATSNATSDRTTLSQNVKPTTFEPAQSNPTASTILSDPAPAFNASSFVTQNQLTEQLNALTNALTAKFEQPATSNLPQYVAADGNGENPFAATNAINNLNDVTITNANLTASEIPDLSGTYLAISSTSTARSTLGLSYAATGDFVPSYNIAAWGDSLTSVGPGVTSWPTQLSTLFGGTRYIYNGGISGQTSAQIASRMRTATDKFGYTTVIWAGRNDITGNLSSDEPAILSSIASMVAAVTTSNYLVLSIPNTDSEPSGSTNYSEIVSINSALASTYPGHYFDIREYLVQHGLADAGITPTTQDLTDIANDEIPADLTTDGEHLTTAGYGVVAQQVYDFVTTELSNSSQPHEVLTLSNLESVFSTPPVIGESTPNAAVFTDLTANTFNSFGSVLLYATSTNLALGFGALLAYQTTGTANTAIGYDALTSNTSGQSNVSLGYESLFSNSTGSNNTAIGYGALFYNATGTSNTANGELALQFNTGGKSNVASGGQALQHNSTGSYNTASGYQSLYSNTTGTNNAATGYGSLYSNTTGSSDVVEGAYALYYNVSATSSVAVGSSAGIGSSAGYNDQGGVFVGANAGNSLTTDSDYNTLIGYKSGYNITSGNDNVVIGSNVNTGGTHVTTGANDILIGYNANTPTTTESNFLNIGGVLFGTLPATTSATTFSVQSGGMIGIGTSTPYAPLSVWGSGTASSTLAFNVVNSASTTVFSVFDGGNAELSGSLSQSSDERLKTNIQSLDGSSSLSFIDELNPVTFNWIDPEKGATPQLGFIAQQVLPIFPTLVSTTSATALTPDGTLSLNYIGLISPIVSAIQELSADIASIENAIAGFATSFTTEQLTFTRDLCAQESNGTQICITGDQLAALVAQTGEGGGGSVEAGAPSNSVDGTSDTPPVIQMNGDNPAIVQVGDTYNDLGATITGPQADLNLGLQTFVNGVAVSPVQIDTSQAATDTIDYVATDQNGLTATSTRTVIIEAPSIVPTGMSPTVLK